MKSLKGVVILSICLAILVHVHCTTTSTLPSSFDARMQWPSCMGTVQAILPYCKSYYAAAMTMSTSARRCIAGQASESLSYQYIIDCSGGANQGCNGGSLAETSFFLLSEGTVSVSCIPYVDRNQQCPTECVNGGAFTKYKPSGFDFTTNIDIVKSSIMTNGPASADFPVYEDFLSYSGGVYQHTSGSLAFTMSVVVYGWGTDSVNGISTPFWIITPNFSENFGEAGFARVAFGQGIETNNFWMITP